MLFNTSVCCKQYHTYSRAALGAKKETKLQRSFSRGTCFANPSVVAGTSQAGRASRRMSPPDLVCTCLRLLVSCFGSFSHSQACTLRCSSTPTHNLRLSLDGPVVIAEWLAAGHSCWSKWHFSFTGSWAILTITLGCQLVVLLKATRILRCIIIFTMAEAILPCCVNFGESHYHSI